MAAAVALQSLGSFALFFVVWFIGRMSGPAAQGRFSEVKSIIDLSAVVFMMGLPQSCIYVINTGGVQRRRLIDWALRWGLVVMLSTGAFLLLAKGAPWLPDYLQANSIVLGLAVAVGTIVVFGILRGVWLTVDDGWSFSLLTATPTLLLAAVVTVQVSFYQLEPAGAYAVAGTISALIAWLGLRRASEEGGPIDWRALYRNGSAVFMQGALMTAQPLLAIAMIRHRGGSYEHVAFFSLAIYVYQAGIVPLSMVAPILFNRWTTPLGSRGIEEFWRLATGLLVLVPLVAFGYGLTPWFMGHVFGPEYSSAVLPIRLMLLSVPFAFINQLSVPAFMARGMFAANTILAGLRLLTMFCSFAVFISIGLDAALPTIAVGSWLCAEILIFVVTLTILVLRLRTPGRERNPA